MAQKGKWGQKCSQWFYNQLRKWYELPLVKRDSRERALESKGGFEDSFLLLELWFFSSRSLAMPLIGIWMIMLGLLGLDLFGLVVGVVTHLPSVKGKDCDYVILETESCEMGWVLFEYIYSYSYSSLVLYLLTILSWNICLCKIYVVAGCKERGGGIASCILCILCIRRSVSKRLKTVSCECKCCLGELHLIDEHVRDC